MNVSNFAKHQKLNMKASPSVLLLPNSSSEYFRGRCGDLTFIGLYVETDPCLRDGTDGKYELR